MLFPNIYPSRKRDIHLSFQQTFYYCLFCVWNLYVFMSVEKIQTLSFPSSASNTCIFKLLHTPHNHLVTFTFYKYLILMVPE